MLKTKIDLERQTIWQISREYAGIAEAGGVKNVACSLAEALVELGTSVVQFIPLYGFVKEKEVFKNSIDTTHVAHIVHAGSDYTIHYKEALFHGVTVIFVDTPLFNEKNSVYTYTAEDEKSNPKHKQGSGFEDTHLINTLFQKAVLLYARLTSTSPNVIHCHDAHTAMIPAFIASNPALKKQFEKTKCIVTIHNAGEGYRQAFSSIEEAYTFTELPFDLLQIGRNGNCIEPFLIAGYFATLSTVSPWYAKELLQDSYEFNAGFSHELFKKHSKIVGITNGIDFARYDPTSTEKSGLTCTFNPSKGDLDGKYKVREEFLHTVSKPLSTELIEQFGYIEPSEDAVYFGYHGRIAHQKGLDILGWAAQEVLKKNDNARFIIIGHGSPELEQIHIHNAQTYAGRYVYFKGYERSFVRTCVASCDFLVLPSLFEPCGLEDFIAQIFGTVPVAHAVGGLQKIIHEKTGILYNDNSPQKLAEILLDLYKRKHENPRCFDQMIQCASDNVKAHYSWETIVDDHYLDLYFS